jgi:ABC-type Fe3+-hydroxamate transport system substrate-binding protein
MRIVSCVPSITELVSYFDANQLVGRTRFCTEPDFINGVTIVGGTKNLNLNTIRSLEPDIILAVKEENSRIQIEKLMLEFRVMVFDIETIQDAFQMIGQVGNLTQRASLAFDLCKEIKDGFRNLDFGFKIPVLYLIWENPFLTVGGDTFIHNMLLLAGLRNVFHLEKRYPLVDIDKELPEEPKIVILSSEPYSFKEIHIELFQKKFPNSIITLADGSMFSWYGNRMTKFPEYILNFRQFNGI